MRDLCSYQTAQSTCPRSASPAYPFTLVRFANNTALILPPQADQCFIPRPTETFTQRRRRRICAGSPHANGSCSQLPVNQVLKLGKKHVSDGAEVLLRLILTELHEDQLLVPDIRRAADHQSCSLRQQKDENDLNLGCKILQTTRHTLISVKSAAECSNG